jgi:hypothetical protein
MFALSPVHLAGVAALRFASNSNYAPSAFQALSGTRLRQKGRIAFWVGSADCSELVLSFYNWALATTAVSLGGNAYTIEKCALEKDGAASSVPVTFGGSRTKVIAAGDTDIQCDPIQPSSFGLAKFDRGQKMWIRLEVSVTTAGHQVPKGIAYNGSRGGSFPTWVGFAYDPAENGTTSDIDSFGTIGLGTGTFTNNVNPVTPVVLGRFIGGDAPTWLGLGDSIMDFSNDTLTGFGYAGFFSRSMVNDTNNGSWIGGMDFGSSGSKASMWTGANAAKATAYWKYAKYAVDEFGTNNFAAADTLATVQGQATTLWALAYANGIRGILRTKLLPRMSGSTDSYATEANMTPLTEFQAGGKAALFNTWLDTQIGAGLCTTVIDFTTMRGVDPWKWVVTGAANYATSDGIHPSPAGHGLMATALRTAMGNAAYA